MKIVHTLVRAAHSTLRFEHIGAGDRGVTGSEQAMLYLAKDQVARGHHVVCYFPTDQPGFHEGVEVLDATSAWPRFRRMERADVVIAWLSADPLKVAPPSALRIHSLQINDWLMNAPGYHAHVDQYVFVSQAHKAHLSTAFGFPEDLEQKAVVLPNGVDTSRFHGSVARVPHRCVYLSSPDRGLHWVLAMWPEIRFAYPDAELHVFYEVQSWLHHTRGIISDVGLRARYVERRLQELARHGVILRGPVAPTVLAEELLKADVQLYPCDPVSFTEGFGVAVLEACAAGVVPIITDADAFGEIYGESGAVVVPRRGGAGWTDDFASRAIAELGKEDHADTRERVRLFASGYDWAKVGAQWADAIDTAWRAKHGG